MRGVFLRYFDFFRRERERLVLFSALVLVGVLSFQAGFLAGGSSVALPLVIEKPAVATSNPGRVAGVSDASPAGDPKSAAAVTPEKKDCAFVGSRNSTLYHLPTCASAKRIKPENIVCFVSVEDAVARGYKPGCLK
ncbi:MAG: hypothetical protein KBD19_02650 [Candidatus Moranbacteria bacterium]|nr:hypothetical protein [Candidatus Moranbacteria bacterium]